MKFMSASTNIQIDVSKLKPVTCPQCGGSVFDTAFNLRIIPGFLAEKPGVNLVQVPVYICRDCGEILSFNEKSKG